MSRWASIDPAGRTGTSGVVVWEGDRPRLSLTVRPIGKAGKWGVWEYNADGRQVDESVFAPYVYVGLGAKAARWRAWVEALAGAEVCVVEDPKGRFRGADDALGRGKGYLEALCDWMGSKYIDMPHSTWQRVTSEIYAPLSWLSNDKEHTIKTCKRLGIERLGFVADDDRAEALMVGAAALALKLV